MTYVDGDPSVGPASVRHPSWFWLFLALLLFVASIAAVVSAVAVNTEAQRPVGEGELFFADGLVASTSLGSGVIAADDLRHLRNELTVEAVSLIGVDGTLLASTSASLTGADLASPTLAGFAERGRFGAVAAPLTVAVLVDDVVEWDPGDVVYQVVQPLGDGRAVLLTYDISELLERRRVASGFSTAALQLLGVGALLLIVVVLLLVGRSRAANTYRQFALESGFLQRESNVLTVHNRELETARERAEHAYQLAEEKNRIRSEFVLMINHELRTPLTGVVTGAELLHSGGAVSDPEWLDILDGVRSDGNRLREMIDQILAVARIENRALFFELHPVGASEVMDRLAQSHPRFTISYGADLEGLVVETDPTSVVNLIRSLADNAYSHGADNVGVSVVRDLPFEPMVEAGKRPDRSVYLLVADDGPGIEPAFLPRAFEKFEKDSQSSGTGLGLYIARMMAEALEASILVTTSADGTTMAIALPLTTQPAVAR